MRWDDDAVEKASIICFRSHFVWHDKRRTSMFARTLTPTHTHRHTDRCIKSPSHLASHHNKINSASSDDSAVGKASIYFSPSHPAWHEKGFTWQVAKASCLVLWVDANALLVCCRVQYSLNHNVANIIWLGWPHLISTTPYRLYVCTALTPLCRNSVSASPQQPMYSRS